MVEQVLVLLRNDSLMRSFFYEESFMVLRLEAFSFFTFWDEKFHQLDGDVDDDFVFSAWKIVTFRDDEKLSLNERHSSLSLEQAFKAKKKNPQQKLAVEKQSEIDKLLPALFSPF